MGIPPRPDDLFGEPIAIDFHEHDIVPEKYFFPIPTVIPMRVDPSVMVTCVSVRGRFVAQEAGRPAIWTRTRRGVILLAGGIP